jgi:hypothetical protein
MAYIVPPTSVDLAPSPLPRGMLLDIIPEWDANGVRWFADGVRWEPFDYGTLRRASVNACSPATHGATQRGCLDYVTALPFALEDAYATSTMNVADGDGGGMVARWELLRSAAFATELITGSASGGRSLSSDATAPTGVPFGSPATTALNALSVMESHLAEVMQGGRGYIHVSPALLPLLVDHLRLVGDRWETPTGHIVVADAGYVNAAAPDGEAASAAGEDWIYASGPVRWQYREGVGGGEPYVDITTNDVLMQMTGYGILLFEPEPVTAVLVSYASGE